MCMCINNTQQSLGFLVKLENKKHVKLQCNIGIIQVFTLKVPNCLIYLTEKNPYPNLVALNDADKF